MRNDELVKFKQILILGYGVEGKASYDYLKKIHPEAKVAYADEKDDLDYLKKQYEFDLVIKTPGIQKNLVKTKYTTATNIFFANFKGKIIGVTGTKGKSTTVTLIYRILKASGFDAFPAGNIGLPALAYLMTSKKKEQICVYELSSYQLDDINFSPHIGVLTSLFPDHMNYHSSFEDYVNAKMNITRYQTEDDFFIYNPKITSIDKYLPQIKSQKIPFSKKIPVSSDDLKIKGDHNIDNIRASLTATRLFGVKNDKVSRVIMDFEGLPHRMQNLGRFSNITFIDDAAATTPQSTIYAIKTICNVNTIFLGGQDRGYRFDDLCHIIDQSSIENIVLYKDTGEKIKQLLSKLSKRKFNYLTANDLKQGVSWAYKITKPNTTCLLSMASPSYSIWKNFNQKGDQFKYYVLKYAP
ncbi:UDP-N-acetylmuramoylalanine--D-glutamate ligase [Candidatus Roizmanbacteria bacterium RIFCSPHIGHO2_02_FULL_37_13b]|uniref:UDP-N-acetylmuramoylalanine--D-glutamate ligase n=1 Tax=Candidatus Roizmanbacteria bacterium RIFCSPLOWO2_02_FULL_36_11 TaxID=1802071 RepID=A0A1F7JG52_9BACT|nr:MAG: UDP-N-acetylmuramoylalanine--D-glutamate ligase [Candidatus Roizmanbacteria bacterium RIFCSPHIGHO2_02_FULL_37_13b]OGK54598.1 MAG: UDP-N-acetylmuramoylalanine--D-glutamate ligase [Candidatus Roizmanbacteria bacterium RIFCSPLOWO2_02_FULL_36_11]